MKDYSITFNDILQSITIIIGLSTALLYLYGNSFYTGYLMGWGIPPELFKISFEETLIYGLLDFTYLSITPIKYLIQVPVSIFFIVFFINLAAHFNKVEQFFIRFVSFIKFKNNDPPKETPLSSLLLFSANAMVVTLFIVFVFIGFIFSLKYSGQKGREWGIEEKINITKQIFSKTNKKYPKIILKKSNKLPQEIEGYIIKSSTQHEAIYTGKKLYVLPANKIEYLSISNNE